MLHKVAAPKQILVIENYCDGSRSYNLLDLKLSFFNGFSTGDIVRINSRKFQRPVLIYNNSLALISFPRYVPLKIAEFFVWTYKNSSRIRLG